MKLKRVAAFAMAGVMAASLAACGNKDDGNKDKPSANNTQGGDGSEVSYSGIIEYADLDLDKDCKDLTAEINFSNQRTDLEDKNYSGKKWTEYIADFNKLYPNIKVNVNTVTDYEASVSTFLQSTQLQIMRREFLLTYSLVSMTKLSVSRMWTWRICQLTSEASEAMIRFHRT